MSFTTDLNPPILVLDGGLGTTLEDLFQKDVSTPLWSAGPIDDEPEAIISTHLAFLRAGANIISTSTYQCAFSTFEKSGYSRARAIELMRKSVLLAAEAKSRYIEETNGVPDRDIHIALSLGPFGATLSPAQEFDGFYPPPYGPMGLDTTNPRNNHNTFVAAEDEEKATEALRQFHLERLRVFTEESNVWDAIDFVAFETVPLRREIIAIRRAIGDLKKVLGRIKPWWVSTVHSVGVFPEDGSQVGEKATMEEVLRALIGEKEPNRALDAPIPAGIGINCTSMEFLPRLLDELSQSMKATRKGSELKLWLVVYPNGGKIWDPFSRTWGESDEGNSGSSAEVWADQLVDQVEIALKDGIWQGIVVGGCCKVGPGEIGRLVSHLGVVTSSS